MENLSLEHHLSPDLIPEDHFGRRIGIRSKCLPDLIEAGFFPRPHPLKINGRYYFKDWMVGAFLTYMWNYAENFEIDQIAQILRKHDPRCLDYREIRSDETTREWLNDVLVANTDEEYLP